MLKITTRNENINRRMAQKEITYLFHKLFRCFYVFPSKTERFKAWKSGKTFSKRFSKSEPNSSRNKIFISQLFRYCLNWQSKLLSPSWFTKSRTICILTGRSRSVYRAFRLSRLKIRSYAAAGHFIGLSKASW